MTDCNPIMAPVEGCECRVCRLMAAQGYPERPYGHDPAPKLLSPLKPVLTPSEPQDDPPEGVIAPTLEKDRVPDNLDYYNQCGGW